MPALIIHDDLQLRRIEDTIARIKKGTAAKRLQHSCLLSALESERAELLRYSPHRRRATIRRPTEIIARRA